jgi:hypothetical protein
VNLTDWEDLVSQPGAITALAATCHRVAETLPTAEVGAARQRTTTALAQLAAAGTTRNPHFLQAASGLTVILADLTTVADDLAAVATHVRAFQGQLG